MRWVVAGVALGCAMAGQAHAEGEITFADYAGLTKERVWVAELTTEGSSNFPERAEYDATSTATWTLLVVSAPHLEPVGRLGVFIERGKGSGTGKDGRYTWTYAPPDRATTWASGQVDRTSVRAVSPPKGAKLGFAGELRLDPRGKAVRAYPIEYPEEANALFVLWPELPARPVLTGQSYSVKRPVELMGLSPLEVTLQVKVAKVEGDVVLLEWRGTRSVEARELIENDSSTFLQRYPRAKGQLTLSGAARVRRGETEWLDGGLEAQLHLADGGKTIVRNWSRYRLTMTPRVQPELVPFSEHILEYGTGN